MRIHIVDTLTEDHLTSSLADALRELGHVVRTTGPVWQSWRLPRKGAESAQIDAVVDDVIAARPDVVLVMRTSALGPEHLRRLRRQGICTVAWFSDDPVLYRKQSKLVAAHYDLTLHAAMEPVLELYERELGVRGLGMQFWAGEEDFPRSYDPAGCDVDLVFLGNMHSPVKRWRYDWIASLPVSRAAYGKVAADPAGLVVGFVDTPVELARAAARGRFGLNISQRFVDYEGSIFTFPQLTDLGEFPLPSRVVQLASVGVPVLALVASDRAADDLLTLFPPVIVVRDATELTVAVAEHDDDALAGLSTVTHDWCAEHYRPLARARFLHAVLRRPDRFRRMDARGRALAFLDHPVPSRRWLVRTRRVMPVADAAWRLQRRVRRLVPRARALARRAARSAVRRLRGRTR